MSVNFPLFSFRSPQPEPDRRASGAVAAWSAAAVTVPHAVGLGLLAFAPLAFAASPATMALWSAALPGCLLTWLARRRGVVYAPTTVVALLFAAVLNTALEASTHLGLSARQVLAVSGATVALAFMLQWLLGVLQLATVVRFLPISVTHGFAAGVGLSMVLGQVRGGWGLGGGAVMADGSGVRLAAHALVALAVVVVALLLLLRRPRVPGLLAAVAGVSVLCAFWAASGGAGAALLVPAAPAGAWTWPLWPDWRGVPWMALLQGYGGSLVVLAFLMAWVNSLEILVFHQELELDHGVRSDANLALRRESLVGALCGLVGMIPASTSASRSRIVLTQSGVSSSAGVWHAAIMLGVGLTGVWWLHWVPMAALSGALVLAGLLQVPALMWSGRYARRSPATWTQSWLVALVFAFLGGVGAVVVGLVVATFVLLRESASKVLRHVRLDGELRSRRLRRAGSDGWLSRRMNQVAVFELQGVMSFGVAAHLAGQVRRLLQPRHRWVVLDASRVPAWDSTAMAQLRALSRDLEQQGIACAVSALDAISVQHAGSTVRVFADLDRALEWAEAGLLAERPPDEELGEVPACDGLGELGDGLPPDAGSDLVRRLHPREVPDQTLVFAAGQEGDELMIVRSGHIALMTHWPASQGLRLATVGPGMAFGEMAFLQGVARTACAGAEQGDVQLWCLSRAQFDEWAQHHPGAALRFMNNLAQIAARRLALTSLQLQAVLE